MLSLRLTPVCRRLTHSASRVGVRHMSTVTELVSKLGDGSVPHLEVLQSPTFEQLDSATFADALWKSVYSNQFQRVCWIYRDLPLTANSPALVNYDAKLAVMAAAGSLRQIEVVLSILESLKRDSSSVVATPRLLYVLIHSLCCSDEVKSAEVLLSAWAERIGKQQSKHEHTEISDAGHDVPPPPPAPMSVLRGLLRSWQSMPVLPRSTSPGLASVLEERVLLTVEKFDWSQLGSAPVPLHVWSTLIRSYAGSGEWRRCVLLLDILEKELLAMPSLSSSLSRSTPASTVVSPNVLVSPSCVVEPFSLPVQRSLLYHSTLYALGLSHDSDLVLHFLQRMRENGISPGIAATLSLLKTFRTATPSLSPTAVEEDLINKRQQLLSMVNKIIVNIKSLAAMEDGYPPAKTLTKETLHALSKLGLADVADEVLQVLGRHAPTANFATYPQLVYPILLGWSHDGANWKKSVALFERIAHRHREHPTCFHAVCDVLHRASEFDKLSEFVETYGDISLTNEADMRKTALREILKEEEKKIRKMDDELMEFIAKHNEEVRR